MKKSLIKVGHSYSNGKGRVRKVVAFGDFILYASQHDHDCVEYEVVDDGTIKQLGKGLHGKMTLSSFAVWAKKEIV